MRGHLGILIPWTLLHWIRALNVPSSHTTWNELRSDSEEDQSPHVPADKYITFENVEGEGQLKWVRKQNRRTERAIVNPDKSALRREILQVLTNSDSIPFVTKYGRFLYNLWQDNINPRGLWRRTVDDEFLKDSPHWEIVLNLDQLSIDENESWIWGGCSFFEEDVNDVNDYYDHCLMELSRGGADAAVVREFNVTSKTFVEDGFNLPEAKSTISWFDRNTVCVGTNFGSTSMTASGYPRIIKRWQRGTQLSDAVVVHEGIGQDVQASAYRTYERLGHIYDWQTRSIDFFKSVIRVRIVPGRNANKDESKDSDDSETYVELDIPQDAEVDTFADQLLLSLKSGFEPVKGTKMEAGWLVATSIVDFVNGKKSSWTYLFRPTLKQSLQSFAKTQHYVVLNILDSVQGQLIPWRYNGDGTWTQATPGTATIASFTLRAKNGHREDGVWITSAGFLQPTTLYLVDDLTDVNKFKQVKQSPLYFNTTGLEVTQRWATSDDGTQVPYFLVCQTANCKYQPTLLYGYGGFEIAETPFYSGTIGRAWLQRGGVYALANIRGGGEFGPAWHKAAMRKDKLRSYEDMAAVARHLLQTGVTTTKKLGVSGGSNGGLMAANMMVLYPRLFGAVIARVPLIDMYRYNKLLAGASWVAEYGDPDDPNDWAFMKQFSPYHNLNASINYPPVLFMTSTRDDRVHPAHARKMTAKMQYELPKSSNKTFLYEETEGGHGSLTPSQMATSYVLQYEFLERTLGLTNKHLTAPEPSPPMPAGSGATLTWRIFKVLSFLAPLCAGHHALHQS